MQIEKAGKQQVIFYFKQWRGFWTMQFSKSDALRKYPGSSGRGQIAGSRIFFVSRLKDLSVRRKQNLCVSRLQDLYVSRLQNALAAVNKNAP